MTKDLSHFLKDAMAAFTEMPNLKMAVIVDEDVDIYDERGGSTGDGDSDP
jgi:UbiD family decarboxylase